MAEKSSIDLELDPKVMIGSRMIDAPRELVWSVWTDPKHLAQWWGPDGFRTTTSAFDINPAGVLVGWFEHGGGAHGCLDSGGAFTTLDVPGAINTRAIGINAAGDIVGWFENDAGDHGFVLHQGVFSIVDIPGVTKVRLFDINGSGVIVGWYQDGLATHGFVGTPVPEPASLGMVSLGLLLTVWAVKRRTS